MIYADNAASTALHPRALEAMLPWLTQHWGNPGSIHTAGDTAARAVAGHGIRSPSAWAAAPERYTLPPVAARRTNQAVLTGAAWGAARGRRHVLAAAFEHPAVLRPLEHLACLGEIELTLLPPDGQGRISIDQAARRITGRYRPGQRHGGQQRGRHPSACGGAGRTVPGTRSAIPHRRGTGRGRAPAGAGKGRSAQPFRP